MGSTSLPSSIQMSSTHSTFTQKLSTPLKKFQIVMPTRDTQFSCKLLHKSVPLAASIAILLWSTPEENQKKYAENDARIKSSPLMKKLLEQSKLNKEKNRKEIENKYCIRGAEWGVGDCSTEGMSPAEREKFIAMLKQKAGVE
ncbi:uncharacterized protein LOC109801055 isoform X2 [Cajanus cajan]|uniref:uncharacterized protein LOC109801055 isoform X2 n=1 Tax=Cajanus cajan TaxID=3821 RepID=UPI00098DA860|nr:uncharacterized protein LOC109801055 isoform X2 [Cajanus cajan]